MTKTKKGLTKQMTSVRMYLTKIIFMIQGVINN